MYDKWMYVLRNLSSLMQRPAALQERVFTRLFDQAEISKFNPQELKSYEDSMNAYRDIVNAIKTAEKKKFAEGMEKGITKGRAQERAEMAKAMLNDGMDIEYVSKISKMSIEELRDL